jgi:hypothetical protein
MKLARRVVSRYVQALGVPLGKSFFSGDLKIHRYRDQIRVTEMVNAGKRGKKVRELITNPTYSYKGDEQAWLDRISDAISDYHRYDQVKGFIKDLLVDYPGEIDLHEVEYRGVDVEPAGTKLSVKTNTGLVIEASPNDFRVLNRQPLSHSKTKEPIGYQDTNYWPDKKQDGILFYAWLKDNLSKVNSMTLSDLTELWRTLGVHYDSH